MKSDPQVIVHLNAQLKNELTATNQYFLHYRMLKHWGFGRLAKHEYDESIEEMKHADVLIERVLYLEGVPNLQRLGKVNVGQTVPEQFRLDLEVEKSAVKALNAAIELCRSLGDNGTRDLLEQMLRDEEDHANWLEAQLTLIQQTGESNYLAQQIREGDA